MYVSAGDGVAGEMKEGRKGKMNENERDGKGRGRHTWEPE